MAKKKPEETLITIDAVTRVFPTGDGKNGKLYVLRGVSMTVARGQIVAIVGASGAGKSTLLHIMGTLDRPTSGRVVYNETEVFTLSDEEIARFRNKWIGFVFQFHHLLPEFTALENVAMPSLIGGTSFAEARERAATLLEQVGLREKMDVRPTRLSGGEQQRIAIARALMNSPQVILADEPSGNLDTTNAQSLHELIRDLSKDHGQTFVIVTHNEVLAKQADKVIKIVDGVVKS